MCFGFNLNSDICIESLFVSVRLISQYMFLIKMIPSHVSGCFETDLFFIYLGCIFIDRNTVCLWCFLLLPCLHVGVAEVEGVN